VQRSVVQRAFGGTVTPVEQVAVRIANPLMLATELMLQT
jgi:hypothetical protein